MHNIFTFTAGVLPERVRTLQAYLDEIQAQIPNHPELPFEQLTKVHFASLLILPGEPGAYGPKLVFENNIDGTVAAYIEELCRVAPQALHKIFSACEGYAPSASDASAPDRGRLREYLRTHVLLPDAAFVGNVGRDLTRIRRERALVDQIERFTDDRITGAPAGAPQTLYDDIRAHVARTDPWALQAKGRLPAGEVRQRRRKALALIPLAVLLLPYLPLICVVLRFHERSDASDDGTLEPQHMARVTEAEDRVRQNHFASVSVVKAGLFRQALLRLVLFAVDRIAGISLGGTLSALDNIHFAHWVLIDGGRRLLFLTNYDGSWENYLDDFIDKASPGLTAIWSNVRGFPKTTFLVWGGSRDERNFKAIARRTQLPTAVFYSAYRTLTVPSIDNDSALRDGLATPPKGAAVDRWLQRL